METDAAILIVVNLMASVMGGFGCLCRMTKMTATDTKFPIRAQACLWFVFFATSGWSFMFGCPPHKVQAILTALAFCATMIGVPAWYDRAPPYTHKEHA